MNKKIMPNWMAYSLYIFLGIFGMLSLLVQFVPNSWIATEVYCSNVFDGFNATKWYSGGYSSVQVNQMMSCYERQNEELHIR